MLLTFSPSSSSRSQSFPAAALASKREEGNQDAIDYCITQAVPKDDRCV